MVTRPKKRRKKTTPPLSDEEMSKLTIKPRWWIEQQTSVEITGYKLPCGDIQAEATHQGIRYRGVLYAVEECQGKEACVPKVLTLKCQNGSPAFDQRLHRVSIVEEDDTAWYASNGMQYLKLAWKEV